MTTKTKLLGYGLIALFSSSLMLSGCIIHVGGHDDGDQENASRRVSNYDYTATNKSVKVSEGLTVKRVSSVNGTVSIEDNVTATHVSNVNGRISIANNVSVDRVKIINGNISIGDGFRAREFVETVNGNISIDEASTVGNNIASVNGNIDLDNVYVGGNIETKNGNVYLLNGTVIEGDVVFAGRPNSNNIRNRPPTLKIDSDSLIKGQIIVYKEVNFEFSDPYLMDKVQKR